MAAPTRWAPWIEPAIRATADVTINSTATSDLTGVAVTIVPHIATRLHVTAQIDLLTVTTSASASASDGLLLIELSVNGSAVTGMVVLRPQVANGRAAYFGQWTVDAAKETSYALKLTARLNNTTGAPSYTVRTTHTSMVLVGLPNLHA